MALKFLHSSQDLDLQSLPDGLIIFLTAKPDSELASTQMQYWGGLQNQLSSELNFFFLTDQASETENLAYLLDENNEIMNQVEKISSNSELGENYIVFYKKNGEVKFADVKENPENEYNWVEVSLELAKNFKQSEPDGDNYYKWGQIVPESGEYLCKDCGYIAEFEAGSIFPVCEVCIAGEPAGPSGPGEGYWEKV